MKPGGVQFVEVPDRLEAMRVGPVSGTPVVLLHHGLGSVSTWGRLPAVLAERGDVPVFAYSRLGHGRSAPLRRIPRPVQFMRREAERVLPRLLTELEVERPLLVGHSDGGSIALLYAASDVEPRPRSLCLFAPHVFVEDCTLESVRRARRDFEAGPLRRRLARHHDDPEGAFRGWSETWLQPEFAAWNIEPSLASVRCPVTVVQGTDDPYGTPAQVDAIDAGCPTPVDKRILEGCGHDPLADRFEESLSAILDSVACCAAESAP